MKSEEKLMFSQANQVQAKTTSSIPGGRGWVVGKGDSPQIIHVNFDYLPSLSSGVKIMGLLGMIS